MGMYIHFQMSVINKICLLSWKIIYLKKISLNNNIIMKINYITNIGKIFKSNVLHNFRENLGECTYIFLGHLLILIELL